MNNIYKQKLSKLLKKNEKINSNNFLPYACHFNNDTILTKNGELLQTIKISGFSEYFDDLQGKDLRFIIREIINENLVNYNFSFYFHTIREKRSVDISKINKNLFARNLHNSWVKKNYLDEKFVNDFYITIIHYGINFPKITNKNFFRSIFFGAEKNYHTKYLVKAFEKLNNFSMIIQQNLAKYGAKKLSIIISKDEIYSENLRFFSKILCSQEEHTSLPVNDLSNYLLYNNEINIGNNSLEISSKNSKKKKKFVSIFSLKQYHELSSKDLDIILKAPSELLITQTMNFITEKKAKKPFEYQNYLYNLNKNDDLRIISGISNFFDKLLDNKPFFATSQTTIMTIANTLEELDQRSDKLYKIASELGIVTFKEDLNLEQCFWSHFPGNFSYINRISTITKDNIAGYCSFYHNYVGKIKNKWGEYISILRTINGDNFYFNFHIGDKGHTILIGQNNTGKKTFINFLLSEATKFDPKITWLENIADSEILVKFLGGKYNYDSLLIDQRIFRPENSFLVKKILHIIANHLTEEEIKILTEILCNENINYDNIDPKMVENLSGFLNSDKFKKYLSVNEIVNEKIRAFCLNDIDEIFSKISVIQALELISNDPDPNPKILVIDKAEKILDNEEMNEILLYYLDKISQNNGIIILIMDELTTKKMQFNFANLSPKMTNIIYSSFVAKEYASKDILGLNKDEFEIILGWNLINRNFLLKQNGYSSIIELSLSSVIEKSIISLSQNNRKIAKEIIINPDDEANLNEIMEKLIEND